MQLYSFWKIFYLMNQKIKQIDMVLTFNENLNYKSFVKTLPHR